MQRNACFSYVALIQSQQILLMLSLGHYSGTALALRITF